jgi:hypothetical protein
MGQVKIHTAKPLNQHFTGKGWAAVQITVSGDLVEPDIRILKMNGFAIRIMIPQVDDGIGPDPVDALAHKAQRPVGIGKRKNFHGYHLLL